MSKKSKPDLSLPSDATLSQVAKEAIADVVTGSDDYRLIVETDEETGKTTWDIVPRGYTLPWNTLTARCFGANIPAEISDPLEEGVSIDDLDLTSYEDWLYESLIHQRDELQRQLKQAEQWRAYVRARGDKWW